MSDPDEDALRRDLVEETLQECERLLAVAEADAMELRQKAQRQAQERAEGTARALTAAAERLHAEAATDRAAAEELRTRADRDREEVELLRDEISAELLLAKATRQAAEAALTSAQAEVERLTALAEERLAEAGALQAELQAERAAATAGRDIAVESEVTERLERLERLEAEVTRRLAEAERTAEERLAKAERAATARLAAVDGEIELATRERRAAADASNTALLEDAQRMAAKLLGDAEDGASRQLAEASAAALALLSDAQRKANELTRSAERQAQLTLGAGTAAPRASTDDEDGARRAAEAQRAADDRLAKADSDATRALLDAMEEARRIVASAEADAAAIRARAQARTQPSTDRAEDQGTRSAEGDTETSPSVGTSQRRRARWQRNARTLGFVLAVLAASGLLRAFVAEPYTVALSSMEPALSDGDRLLLNKLAYDLGDPGRGDVVVFDTDELPGAAGAPSKTLVKRVVGLPGQVVQGIDEQLIVDDEVIEDSWRGASPTPAFGPILVPEGMLFVLGDNRALSVDSRTFGAVPIEAVIGRVEAVIWPPDQVGRI